jgi:hypothetical protein
MWKLRMNIAGCFFVGRVKIDGEISLREGRMQFMHVTSVLMWI